MITLGIIGIVAAMTISTLINNYKKKQTSVKLKRFYSTINQAIQLSEIDNGSVFTWNKEDQALDENGDNISEAQKNSSAQFYNTYLAPYIKTVKLDDSDLQEDIDSRDKALSKCADDGRFCTVLLEVYDNLEFKDDYPYKL